MTSQQFMLATNVELTVLTVLIMIGMAILTWRTRNPENRWATIGWFMIEFGMFWRIGFFAVALAIGGDGVGEHVCGPKVLPDWAIDTRGWLFGPAQIAVLGAAFVFRPWLLRALGKWWLTAPASLSIASLAFGMTAID